MSIAIGRPAIGNIDRLFFPGMALASAVMLFVGFSRSYFLRSADLPALTALYHLHGALFTAWIALFVAQTALVAGRRPDIHRSVGVAGVVLAAAVFVVGVTVSIETLRRQGGGSVGASDPRSFFAIPLGDIIVFAALVAVAVLQRRRTQTHKRLMLLATISLLTAAIARFLQAGTTGLFLGTDAFVLALVVYDLASRGRVHPATVWGGLMVAGFKPLLYALSGTQAWLAFADALRG